MKSNYNFKTLVDGMIKVREREIVQLRLIQQEKNALNDNARIEEENETKN